MKIQKLKEYIKLFEESELSELEIKKFGFKIKMGKSNSGSFGNAISYTPPQITPEKEEKVIDFSDLTEIKSPMVGIFYAAASPESAPYVKKGSKIKKGDIICIIEAMKVMNEITSDYDGEIVDICAENGQLVEFSQVMFKIKQK